ncbi:MAG: cation transporter [Candidatus Humimicrobiaceae bacterium]
MTKIKETYPVVGMSCASCVKKVETVLNKTEGIVDASVNFASEKVTIEYDDEIISMDKVADIVKSIGYELIT